MIFFLNPNKIIFEKRFGTFTPDLEDLRDKFVGWVATEQQWKARASTGS